MFIRRRLSLGSMFAGIFLFIFAVYKIAVPSLSYSLRESSHTKASSALLRTILERNKTASTDPKPLQTSAESRTASYRPEILKPHDEVYHRAMVVARMQDDDVAWMSEYLKGTDLTIYVANDAKARLHPPKNKGHEVIIYLSFIIDHYEHLPDVVLFMHAHRFTHHNSEIFGFDAVPMVQRLSDEYVVTKGYVNMRCDWSPGCPQWLRPKAPSESLSKQEEIVLSHCWHELFPHDSLPETVAHACCAQFALSKKRLQSIPKSRYIFYRDWVMRTPLSDYISGRIWEYSWQYLFTNETVHCPDEYACYCDGFGVCFGGQERYSVYNRLRQSREKFENDLKSLRESQPFSQESEGTKGTFGDLASSDVSKIRSLQHQIDALNNELRAWQVEAIEG